MEMGSSGLYPRNRNFVDQSNPFTNKIFQDAVIRGDLAVITILLKYGIVLRRNERNHQGLTALQQSVLDGNRRLAVRLLESGADLESKTSNGWSCLHIAAATGDLTMVHLLLVHCADVVALTKNEELPIDVAASLEVKLLLAEQLAKAGYSELAQWYTNKMAHRDMEVPTTVSPNHVLENACHSNSASDLNTMPYCSHNGHQLSSPSSLQFSNISEPDISCLSQLKPKQRKLSCWSLTQPSRAREAAASDDSQIHGGKARVLSPYTMSHCGGCGHMYMQDVEDPWTVGSDIVYMSCSSGYLSESNQENRPSSEHCKHFDPCDAMIVDRDSVHSCSPSTDLLASDNLRPVSSNPLIAASPDSKHRETTRSLPRVSRKPSSSTGIAERKISSARLAALERKRSRIELFIDYYRDSLDGHLSDEDEEELGFVLGSDENEGDTSLDEFSEEEPLSPDYHPSYPDQVSTSRDLEEMQAMSQSANDAEMFHGEIGKLNQHESIQILMETMDHEIGLPEQNMYFNPMYKSPPDSSADSQEKLSRETSSRFSSSGMVGNDQDAWASSTASGISTRSLLSTRSDKRKKKKSILSGIVSKLRDSVKMSRSSSDPEFTDNEEPVTRRDSSSVMAIRDKRHVRRSNSFSSYFGSLFDTQSTISPSASAEIKENIDPSCEYPGDYYFVDKAGQMMKKYKHERDNDGQHAIPLESKYQNCPGQERSGKVENLRRDKFSRFSPPNKENFLLESLVTPRFFRKDIGSKTYDHPETRSQSGVCEGYEDDYNDSWNLYPHTIILNNGSLSPDTDDADATASSNFQCSCKDCVLTINAIRGRTNPPMARNTYERRCHSVLTSVPQERGNTTSSKKTQYDAFNHFKKLDSWL